MCLQKTSMDDLHSLGGKFALLTRGLGSGLLPALYRVKNDLHVSGSLVFCGSAPQCLIIFIRQYYCTGEMNV